MSFGIATHAFGLERYFGILLNVEELEFLMASRSADESGYIMESLRYPENALEPAVFFC